MEHHAPENDITEGEILRLRVGLASAEAVVISAGGGTLHLRRVRVQRDAVFHLL